MDEIVTGIGVAVGNVDILVCPAFDDGSGIVRVSSVVSAVLNALDGCEAPLPSWKQPGYSATHDSHNPTETALTARNVAALAERWRAASIDPGPVLAAGRLFAVDSGGQAVMALAAADGREIWKHTVGCGPHPDDSCTYVGRPVLTPDNKLTVSIGTVFGGGFRRFDPGSGEWTDDAGDSFHNGFSGLVVQDDQEYFYETVWASGGPVLVTLDDYLVSFTGFDRRGLTTPTLLGNLVLFGYYHFDDYRIRALDLGRCPPSDEPALSLCGDSWSARLLAESTIPVAFGEARVAVASIDGSLRVYEAATGKALWTGDVLELAHPPAVAHEGIYQPDAFGMIHAFDSNGCGNSQCEPIKWFYLGAPSSGQPVVAGGVLYAGTEDGDIVAFDALGCDREVCRPRWAVETGGGAVRSLMVAGGMVFAVNADNTLRAYGLPPS